MTGPEREPAASKEVEPAPPAIFAYISGELVTPVFMFEAYLLARAGRLDLENCQVIPTLSVPQTAMAKEMVSLSPSSRLIDHWHELIETIDIREDGLAEEDRKILKHLAHYLSYCRLRPSKNDSPASNLVRAGYSPDFYGLLIDEMIGHKKPKDALLSGNQIMSWAVENKVDPYNFQEELPTERIHETRAAEVKNRQLQIEIEIGRFRGRFQLSPSTIINYPSAKRGQASKPLEIETGRALGSLKILENNMVTITIIGPANSGKSTLVASLFNAMERFLEKAKNRSARTAGLRINLQIVDLDQSTFGDARQILGKNGFNNREKVPWTTTLASDTAKKLLSQQANVLLADTPGGEPDEITEILAGPTDIPVLLVAAAEDQNWQAIYSQWANALTRIGLSPKILLRSWLPEEGLASGFTSSSHRKADEIFGPKGCFTYLSGRVVGLNRELVEDDALINSLAALLLTDFGPGAILERKRKSLIQLEKAYQDLTGARVLRQRNSTSPSP